MGTYFTINEEWLQSAVEGIVSRNGIILKERIAQAEQGVALELYNRLRATLSGAVYILFRQLGKACTRYLEEHESTLRLTRSGRLTHAQVALATEERQHCCLMVARIALTGAIVASQRASRETKLREKGRTKYSSLSSSSGKAASASAGGRGHHYKRASTGDSAESKEDEDESMADAVFERKMQTTLLKGLLFAFEAFQECHSMNRDHYPPRTSNNTPGTVGWDTLVLLYLVHRIPQVARHADGSAIDESIGQVIRTWRKLLVALQSIDAGEAPEYSRRRGALSLLNGLLVILFQRFNTHQCSVLLGAVEHAEKSSGSGSDEASRSILHPSRHMVSEVVTYYYYKGRMRLYERQMEEAHETLRMAYALLPPAGYGNEPQRLNKQRVRFFLAVAGVAYGRQIPQEILEADGPLLPQLFDALVSAIERGDPVRFSQALDSHATVFHRRGVYLILQQAKILCYQMVVARVHAAMAALPEMDNSRITISTLLDAYAYIVTKEQREEGPREREEEKDKKREDDQESQSSVSSTLQPHDKKRPREEKNSVTESIMDEDRMALWIAKLITRGYVRGYYSHEHKTLVVSKKAPFPLLQPAL